ncbi:MAG: hypothetical protein FWG31_09110 [Oscillospiraceae bacterium]|nr:hypothetical protein [Oscillospiraceae bacterium]
MLKRFLLPMLLLLVIFAGCSNDANTVSSDTSTNEMLYETEQTMKSLTFREAVELSDCAIIGKYVAFSERDSYVEHTFTVKEVMRGDVYEKTVHLIEMKGTAYVEGTNYSYKTGEDIYNKGEEYILIMNVNDSLFYDYPLYVLVSNIYIPAKSIERGTINENRIPDDVLSVIENAKISKNSNKRNYIESNDIKTIVAETDIIMEVKIIEVEEGLFNGNVYYCEVINIIKGGIISTDKGKVLISLIKDSVEVGETYIVMVNAVSEDSFIYVQSSRKSIIEKGDIKMVNTIIDIAVND